ncbi:XrtA/PEP-CTERM system histidine kinase PrsK [Congregibacter sp.]|jgi:putative PEP-CTERM system histidine kinase|uniref:XrtA/PEP-CTERM system histidine kinase PrsK n=1 Tax=Congregibacter sp. TaxID=2744308 RepID=UPI0039E50ECF
MLSVSLVSHALAALSFGVLSGLLATQWQVKPHGPALISACLATTAWSVTIALGTLLDYPPVLAINATELIRDACWLFFLLQLVSLQSSGETTTWRRKRWRTSFFGFVAIGMFVIALHPIMQFLPNVLTDSVIDATLSMWLLISVSGLLLVEQIYRNAKSTERWGLKFLCLSLGVVFAYDFFMYAEALLFRQLEAELWQARGAVNAIVVPWLAIAISRNRDWRMDVYVSRHVVFHSITLIGTGIYLICMALAGYFIKYLGGSWGGVLQVSFLAGAGVLLGTLLFSEALRARLRVYLSKNFFRNRYDYREEWLKFTAGLTSIQEGPEDAIIRNLAPIVLSEGGLLFQKENDNFRLKSSWRMELDTSHNFSADWGCLPSWLTQSGWVIDIDEWRKTPDIYATLTLPQWLAGAKAAWLVVPLFFQSDLEGILILRRTALKTSVNWEDRDLLKTAGRQAAALLAQQRTSQDLVEARQFDAFNRLSAYVIHDLKNILAQQSLMVANAKKHRDNPAFIDDMITTVDNSVKRMQRLMDQMRSGMRSASPATVELSTLLKLVIQTRQENLPKPLLNAHSSAIVTADRERLTTVFGHLLQNAQEATEDDGEVVAELSTCDGMATIFIRDTGCGMSKDFIQHRLFKPFESTKGLTGMGIGAFESREYVRQLGGEITVSSEVGVGSQFSVSLPLALDQTKIESCEPDTPDTPSGVAH